MYELSAYVALVGVAREATVLVHGARQAEGPLLLARQAVSLREVADLTAAADETALAWTEVADESVDVVCSVEGFHRLDAPSRGSVLREVTRVLRPTGVFAVWLPQTSIGADGLDYWRLEHELNAGFEYVRVLAQMPWSGSCFAPVIDPSASLGIGLSLDERLCTGPVDAVAYLAFASNADVLGELETRCLLVAAPPSTSSVSPVVEATVDGDSSSGLSEPVEAHRGHPTPSETASVLVELAGLRERCDLLDDELSHTRLQLDEAQADRQMMAARLDEFGARTADDADEITILRAEITRLQRAAADAVEAMQWAQRDLAARDEQLTELEKRIARLRRAHGQARRADADSAHASATAFELEAKVRAQEQAEMLRQLEHLDTMLRAATRTRVAETSEFDVSPTTSSTSESTADPLMTSETPFPGDRADAVEHEVDLSV